MKDYPGNAITVHWDAPRCIHVGICTRMLPAVFDLTRRPWIFPDGAGAEYVASVIQRCPTGALRFTPGPGGRAETPDRPTTVQALPDGPLLVRGDLVVEDPAGGPATHETRVALCRCGRSRNQPFCDNSHRAAHPDDPPARSSSNPAHPGEICPPQP